MSRIRGLPRSCHSSRRADRAPWPLRMHAHASPDATADRRRSAEHITLIGTAVNILLAVVKLGAGLLAHSQALVADGVHSVSDLLSDGLVLFAARQANQAPDAEHPYGHRRIETVATVGLGALLIATGVGIVWDAGDRLFHSGDLLQPGMAASFVAALSIVVKEVLYRYTTAVANRIGSSLLLANAWHHRSDAISSVIVLVGVLGTQAGLDYFDAIAAVLVAGMILHIGGRLIWDSVRELIDTALEREKIQELQRVIREVDGVEGLHRLRTRVMAGQALVDVHVQVDPYITVSEGHQIADTVERRLVDEIPEINDVTVHTDPERGSERHGGGRLPLREALLQALRPGWEPLPGYSAIRGVDLHYIEGRVHVDVRLPLGWLRQTAQDAEALEGAYRAASRNVSGIGEVRLLFVLH